MEKVLFASVEMSALGILVEPDARGNAAVVKSMLTPLNVELSRKSLDERAPTARPRRATLSDSSVLEVGDVLFAINGKLVHETPHADVLDILHVDAFSSEDISMVVLSFTDPYLYYRELKAGTLESHAMDDEALFGKIRRAGGWREYLPSLPTWSYFSGSAAPANPSHSPSSPPQPNALSKQTVPAPSEAPRQSLLASAAAALVGTRSSAPAANKRATVEAPKAVAKAKGAHYGAAYLKFSAGEFEQALHVYSSVLERDPLSHTVRVSRSLCYLRLHEPLAALKDAEMCCALKPEWPMSYVCKGAALDAMGKPLDACIAYVCGLVVDPTNTVLQRRVDDLFAKMRWTCIDLDGERVVGPVAAAVLQRDEWGPDLLLDRILLFNDRNQFAKDFLDAPGVQICQDHRDDIEVVKVSLTSTGREKIASCEIYDQDEIVTVNATPVCAPEDVRRLADAGPQRVVRVGVFSGARLAAANLLSGKAGELTVKALSVKRATLFNVYIDRCGTAAANGVYVPQETKNGTYVFENGKGCLLSLETVQRPDTGDNVHAWFITRGRAVLYTCVLPDERGAELFHLGDDNRFVIEMQKLKWRACVGQAPLPRVHRTSTVPSLAYLTGDSDNDGLSTRASVSAAEPGKPSLEDDWSFDVQILAIKGYGNRALNRKDFDTAITCYELVEDQVEAYTTDAQDSLLAGDAFLDALRETVEHRPSFSNRSKQSASSANASPPPPSTGAGAGPGAATPTFPQASSSSSASASSVTADADAGTDCGDPSETSSEARQQAPASLQRILDDAQQSYRHELQREAEAVYKDILLKVLLSKAQLCLETGRAQKALAYAERVCIAPSAGAARPLGFYMQALALASLGRQEEALDMCSMSLETLAPDQVLAQRFEGLLRELKVQIDGYQDPKEAVSEAQASDSSPPQAFQDAQEDRTGNASRVKRTPMEKMKRLGSAFSSESIFSSSPASSRRPRDLATTSTLSESRASTAETLGVAPHELFISSPGASAISHEASRLMNRRIPVAQIKAASRKDKVRSRYIVITPMSITIASKMRQTLHMSKGRLVLYRDDLAGVLIGAVRDASHVNATDSRCFSLVLKDIDSPVVMRAATAADASALSRVIAAWKAGDVSP